MHRSGWRDRIGVGLALVLAIGLLVPACGRAGEGTGEREPGPLRVVVSIPPLEGLVRALAPDDARIDVIVRPGQSPHAFEPLPTDVAALARADLIVTVGLGVEASIPAGSLAPARTLVMAESLGIAAPDEHGHDHGQHEHEDEHVRGGIDPHLWLDPGLVKRFVPALAARVGQAMRSAGASDEELAALGTREAELLELVRSVDDAYRERLTPAAGAAVITQHAAWSRLAERYGLEILGVIQAAESVEPSPAHIAELVEVAGAQGVGAILTEPQLDRAVAARLAERLGVPLGTIDPLGSGDWAAMMRANLDELVRVLATEGGNP